MKVAIYALLDSRFDTRYIGKSRHPESRFNEHRRNRDWVTNYEVIEWVNESIWPKREKYWIKWHRDRGYILINKTSGGGGMYNYIFSSESREKMSRSHVGLKQSSATIERRVSQLRGRVGHKMSKKTRRKISK